MNPFSKFFPLMAEHDNSKPGGEGGTPGFAPPEDKNDDEEEIVPHLHGVSKPGGEGGTNG